MRKRKRERERERARSVVIVSSIELWPFGIVRSVAVGRSVAMEGAAGREVFSFLTDRPPASNGTKKNYSDFGFKPSHL